MNQTCYVVISVVLAGLVLLGIKWMSSPRTAVRGNRLSAFSMSAAVFLVLWNNGILSVPLLWAAMAIGGVLGYVMAVRATMIQMPQMVALLNGLGGGASALVAMSEILDKYGQMAAFTKLTSQLALIVGGLTLSGSLIAAAKLDRRMTQRPVRLAGHNVLSNGSIVLALAMAVFSLSMKSAVVPLSLLVLLLSLSYGVLFAIRVGGADMPITISLLNSFSGLAGAIVGFTLSEPLLVAVGAIVGASGLILTRIMCRAMNRSLMNVLSGAIAKPFNNGAPAGANKAPAREAPAAETEEAADQPERAVREDPAGAILKAARKVIVVPGYGMAIAQAQGQVKRLVDVLEARGVQVDFAIHPVAGRMPGHMNVLLAEVDVPYEKLREMDDVNPEFPETDVVLVVGACDVVNPAANTAEGTPIYGMPVLDVAAAGHVIVCNLDTHPGYSGVDNSLYGMPHVELLLGDAKMSLERLIGEVEGGASDVSAQDLGAAVQAADRKEPGKILAAARKVIVVPGYGMAIAQAQGQVKRLVDVLEARGVQVDFAIHPVAGRMPGHMNVLLAEVDVPYEKLREMDDVNPEFPETDVVLVVGACDVVNPAANTAEGTPIYGMPVLDVAAAGHVIVCNLDTHPGYSGVDNSLYGMPHVELLLGDAKMSLERLIGEVEG